MTEEKQPPPPPPPVEPEGSDIGYIRDVVLKPRWVK